MTTTTEMGVYEHNLEPQNEKQMGGCMTGFFNLFDRSHLLSGKRFSPKCLPSPTAADSCSEPVSSVGSPAISRELEKPSPPVQPSPKSAAPGPMVEDMPKSPLAVSTLQLKEGGKSPWKSNKETPRLSLDSRAVVDAKGCLRPREIRVITASSAASAGDEERENQRCSPSVVARLMGLERLPSSSTASEPEKVELRRSASESRSRDYRFFDAPSFLSPVTSKIEMTGDRKSDPLVLNSQNPKAKHQIQSNPRRLVVEKRSFFDTADFFPPEIPTKYQNQQQSVTIYGEIERKLRMRGISEPSKDLETLKNILEALQLKGLLHSRTANRHQNLVFDRRFSHREESPIVLMKPAPSDHRRRFNSGEPSVSPRRERPPRGSSSGVRQKGGPLSIETQSRRGETTTKRRTTRGLSSGVQSPRRVGQTVNGSPRSRRSTVEICERVGVRVYGGGPLSAEDEVSKVSGSTLSHTDNERWRVEEYGEGRNLLERCDKLLHSIAEMNSNSNSNLAELQQPSPVSVLDSCFYKDDESSPSPVKMRTIDFKDQVAMELDDELWSPSSSTKLLSKPDHDTDSSDDSDFSYVSEVLRASNYLPEHTDLFFLLEKHNSMRGKANSNSKSSILQRKLIFDTITEILDRNRHLLPWKAISLTFDQIWSEFRKIREPKPSEDLFQVICGVLKKDLAGDSINGWADCHVEVSEAVLDIERLIFKDLIGETIRDLAAFGWKNVGARAFRRKLIF